MTMEIGRTMMLIFGNQDQRTNKTGDLLKKDISCFCNVDICISSISLQELKILETFLDFSFFLSVFYATAWNRLDVGPSSIALSQLMTSHPAIISSNRWSDT